MLLFILKINDFSKLLKISYFPNFQFLSTEGTEENEIKAVDSKILQHIMNFYDVVRS